MKPQPVLNYSTPQSLDASIQRACRHNGCGGEMVIGGKDFVRLTDPFVSVAGTLHCARCLRTDWLASFHWADTGEDLVSYRTRVRKAAPAALKIWSAAQLVVIVSFDLIGIIIGAFFGVITGTHAGGVFGAVVGFVLAVGLGPLILWPISRMLRADFRRYL